MRLLHIEVKRLRQLKMQKCNIAESRTLKDIRHNNLRRANLELTDSNLRGFPLRIVEIDFRPT